ncbi:hypothetical protein [Fluviicola sp.]|uniref:hypothetical protein n=1 Tax=Fluviicola sp. TaxID=1917219 RepID=UPI0031CEA346
MKSIFLLGGMALFSVVGFSQELKVSNQRTAVADPNQKQLPVTENTAGGTLIVAQPIERAMNAAEQSSEKTAGNAPVGSSVHLINATERASNQSSNPVPEKPANSTNKKPE